MFDFGCPVCGSKNIYKYNLCESCCDNLILDVSWTKELDYVDKVVVGGLYVGMLRKMILDYKFNDKVFYSKVFSQILVEKLFKEKLHMEYPYITYVPMNAQDFKQRGYNQSKILAENISEDSLLKLVEPIVKIKSTKKQVEVENKDRYKNLKSAFESRGVVPERVIVVDDVITTGSTLEEVAKTLKENGAKKVAAIVATTHYI